MVHGPSYTFRAVSSDDLPLLNAWRAAPHVRAWWDQGCYTTADLADPRVARCIVSVGDTPFAYMQDYDVHGWADHPFGHFPPGARGIDQFIGVAALLGQGHGPGFIAQRLRTLFAQGAPVVGTDPHPDNARAIAAYRKAGFAPLGAPQQTQWGLILPMAANAP